MLQGFRDSISKLKNVRLLVVGDMILDHYLIGSADRISPEAPVPVVLINKESCIPGGAANVARNILAVGVHVACAGVVGDDDQGRMLTAHLAQDGADCSSILTVHDRPTTTKTRVLAQNQQMLRLDREDARPISKHTWQLLLEHCIRDLSSYNGVVVSDYGKGSLPEEFLAALFAETVRMNIPVFVDPKGKDYTRYRGATTLTPNAREASEASGFSVDDENIIKAAEKIMDDVKCSYLVITRGASGLALFNGTNKPLMIPTSAREVFDVTGAGDTFISWLAMCVSSGMSPEDACALANIAAGIAVGKVGCATVTDEEVLALI